MSCNQKTLCTPDGEAKVLVVNPGSTDPANPPAGYVNGAPYAGDLDALIECEEGGEAVDCEGNPFSGSVLTTATGLPNIDTACAPPLPNCPVDGQITIDDKGITWQLIGGVWEAVAFTPGERVERVNVNPSSFQGAAIGALVGQGFQLHPDTPADTVCVEWTNDDCVPHCLSGYSRTIVTEQLQPGHRSIHQILTNVVQGPAGFTLDGTPSVTLDTERESAGFERELYGNIGSEFFFSAPLNPGETVQICIALNINVLAHTSTNANDLISYGSTNLVLETRRCLQV